MRRLMAGLATVFAACATLGTAAPVVAAALGPQPIARIHPAHRLLALTLRPTVPFHRWPQLAELLQAQGAQATLFVTLSQIRSQTGELRQLRRQDDVELGLAGTAGEDPARLQADSDEAERLLGDRIGMFQPEQGLGALRAARGAYRAGLVTVLWTRRAGDPSQLQQMAQQAAPGDIVRFDLAGGSAPMGALAQALAALRDRGLLVTSASGLIEDATQHLEYCSAAAATAPAAVKAGDARRTVPLRAIYPAAGIPARALWHLGRPGELLVRRFYGVKPGVRLDGFPVGGRLPAEVRAIVRSEARRLYVAPVGATLGHPAGQVVPDTAGRRVDERETSARIWAAKDGEVVRPVLRVVYARWRSADIAALTDVLGRYRTWIDGSSGRYMNIQKGAARINNRIIFPGETFSVLGAIGDVTRQPGWHRAPVIVWGSYTEGVGGGLCQISSTLYNSVYRAQLRIVERHHHAKRVHYVPRGRDATIAWPDLDFRFANQRRTPVVLRAYVRGGALWTMVLGKADEGHKPA